MADHHDAALIVQLAQWASMMGFEEAVSTIFSDDYDPETATAQDVPVRRVLQLGETIGTLHKHGLLDGALIHDWLWVDGLWSRVRTPALEARERFGEPRLFENFEALAASAPS
jgi:hypothetical protein